MTIEFRADGGAAIGMGHVVRSIALAQALGGDCRFLMRYNLPAVLCVRDAGFPALLLPEEDANRAAAEWVAAAQSDLLIVDLYDVPLADREALARVRCPTVTLSDLRHDDLPGDLLFNGFVGYGRSRHQRTSFGGEAWLGTDYKLLRAQPLPEDKVIAPLAGVVAILPGGGDASGLAPRCLEALAQLSLPLQLLIFEGPAMDVESDAYRAALEACPHAVQRHRTADPFARVAAADLAISAGGDTVYELAVLGVPTLILCHVEHQLETAAAFAEAGAAGNLGLVRDCAPDALASAVERLARDAAARRAFSQTARRLVDGGGLARVTRAVRSLLSSR